MKEVTRTQRAVNMFKLLADAGRELKADHSRLIYSLTKGRVQQLNKLIPEDGNPQGFIAACRCDSKLDKMFLGGGRNVGWITNEDELTQNGEKLLNAYLCMREGYFHMPKIPKDQPVSEIMKEYLKSPFNNRVLHVMSNIVSQNSKRPELMHLCRDKHGLTASDGHVLVQLQFPTGIRRLHHIYKTNGEMLPIGEIIYHDVEKVKPKPGTLDRFGYSFYTHPIAHRAEVIAERASWVRNASANKGGYPVLIGIGKSFCDPEVIARAFRAAHDLGWRYLSVFTVNDTDGTEPVIATGQINRHGVRLYIIVMPVSYAPGDNSKFIELDRLADERS